jgi:hypothetical protein
MQEDELTALAARMGAVLVRFEQRCESLEQQQSMLAQRLPAMLQEKVDGLLQTLSGQAGVAVREGMAASMDAYQRHVQTTAVEANQTMKAFKDAQTAIASQRRWVRWSLGVVLALSIVSLVATYEGLCGFCQTSYVRLKAQVTCRDAVNKSDVVPCGNGQLGAHVEPKSPRHGDKKPYREVAPRPRSAWAMATSIERRSDASSGQTSKFLAFVSRQLRLTEGRCHDRRRSPCRCALR